MLELWQATREGKNRMSRFVMRLSKEDKQEVQRLAQFYGTTVSDLIRGWIDGKAKTE